MAAHKEIITLQFGHFSNFVGTHWWNIQELGFDYSSSVPSDIDHDVLFREGETKNGEVTFTPRLLLADLAGSLGSLPEHGGLYESSGTPDPTQVPWGSGTELQRSLPPEKNEFQTDLHEAEAVGQSLSPRKLYNLDKKVQVWSDFLLGRFHPRSIQVVNQYCHNSDTAPFDSYPQGTALWASQPYQENFSDQIRRYAEECDHLQGFHVLLDSTDGFCGLAAGAMQYLNEEYTRKAVLAVPCAHGTYSEPQLAKEGLRLANVALGLQAMWQHCNLVVPISTSMAFWQQRAAPRAFVNLKYDSTLPYHTSAVLAAALDCATLRYRQRNSAGGTLEDLAQELTLGGRKAVAASLCLPFPLERRSHLLDTLEGWDGPLWQSLSSCCDRPTEDRVWAQSVVLRGIAKESLKSSQEGRSHNPAYTCTTVEGMLRYYLECTTPETASHVTALAAPCNVRAPFPHIFGSSVAGDGFIDEEPRHPETGVSRVPVLAGVHACRSSGAMLEGVHAGAARLAWRRLPQLSEAGLERDDFSEALEELLRCAECYNEEFEV